MKKNDEISDSELASIRNDLLHSQHHFSLIQKRLFALIVQQVSRKDRELKDYTIEIRDLVHAGTGQEIYSRIEAECTSLMEKVILKKDGAESTRWSLIAKAKHLPGKGKVAVQIHPDIRDMILNLKEQGNFTPLPVAELLACHSKYGQRIYEMLYSWRRKKKWVVSLEQLRFSLNCTEKYPNFSDFRRFVLERARADLEAHTRMRFQYEAQSRGKGKAVTHILFLFDFSQPVANQIPMSEEEMRHPDPDRQPGSELDEFFAGGGELPYRLSERLRNLNLAVETIEKITAWLRAHPDRQKEFAGKLHAQVEIPLQTGGTDSYGKEIEFPAAWAWRKISNWI